jgi:hypothetical protein
MRAYPVSNHIPVRPKKWTVPFRKQERKLFISYWCLIIISQVERKLLKEALGLKETPIVDPQNFLGRGYR